MYLSRILPAYAERFRSGWRILYGLDLRHGTVENAVAKVKYVAGVLGAKLIDLQIGNEPDKNHADGAKDRWSFEYYWPLWRSIKTRFPDSSRSRVRPVSCVKAIPVDWAVIPN